MECENAEGTTLLCILPAKFSKVGIDEFLLSMMFNLSYLATAGCLGTKG